MSSAFTQSHRGGSGSPLVCLHGISDTWRTWELVLPLLERQHDVLAPTLLGHAGAPPLAGEVTGEVLADGVERAMDEADFEAAHIVGNSLGGYVALQLAARGRAESVVALAPAGGQAVESLVLERSPEREESIKETLRQQAAMQEQLKAVAPYAEVILANAEDRRRETQLFSTNFEHIPAELLAHHMRGAAACEAWVPLVELVLREGWSLDAEKITCPVRVVWGSGDNVLPWPSAAVRFRDEWLPQADWVVLDGVGHCPQLDVPVETAQLIVGFTAG